jgi:exonuclease VII large subunit
MQETFVGSTRTIKIAVDRASSETRRTTGIIANLLTIKVRFVQAETRQQMDLCGQLSRSMLGQRKLVTDNELDLARRSAETALIRSRGALDRLLAGIEAADFRGPLKRGFVMVTDENERWLRTAADTVDKMQLLYSDGVVPVRKNAERCS